MTGSSVNVNSSAAVLRKLISTAAGLGAALVAFIASGAGAIARTVLDKLRESVSVKDFGAVGDGVTNDTTAIQAAIDALYVRGGGAVRAPWTSSGYLIGSITLKPGVTLVAETQYPIRSISRATRLLPAATSGAMVVMRSNTRIKGFVFHNPAQKYSLATDTEAWNADAVCIQIGDATDPYTKGVAIEKCSPIGFQSFCEQYSASTGCENIYAADIGGLPLVSGFKIAQCYDIPRFKNVQWNPNSYQDDNGSLFTGDATILRRKVAKNMVAFWFGRVDEAYLMGCFVYCCKYGVWFAKNMYAGDDGNSGGASLICTSFDVCHVGIQIDRSSLNFGVKFVGGFITPVVVISGSEQAAVRWGEDAQFTNVAFDAAKSYGSTVSQLGDATKSDSPNYHFVWQSSRGSNQIYVTGGTWLVQQKVAISSGENSAINSVASLISYRDTHTPKSKIPHNVVLDNGTSDSPDLVFENGNAQWHLDVVGGAGATRLRAFINGAGEQWSSNQDTGNFELKRDGGTFYARSADGLSGGGFGVNNFAHPTFGGVALGKKVAVPGSATAAGAPGQWAADASFAYFYTGDGTTHSWRRIATSAW